MKRAGLLVVIALLFGGCAIREQHHEIQENIEKTREQTKEKINKANTPDSVSVKDSSWLTSPEKRVPYKQELPEQFEETVTLQVPTAIGKDQVRKMVRGMSEFDVRFAVQRTTGERDPLLQKHTYHFKGTFEGLLNTIANKTNTNWKFEHGAITFSRAITRTFRLAALPGSTSMSSSFSTSSNQQGQGGGQSSGGQNDGPQSQTRLDAGSIQVWKSVQKTVKSMLGEQGTVTPSPGLGTITVTDHPTVVKRIGQFIEYQNKKLKQRVTIHYKLLSVQSTEYSNAGIQWKAIMDNLGDQYSLALNGGGLSGGSSNGLSMNLINSAGDLSEGTRALVEAFKSTNNASVVTDGSVTTLNNQPVPVQVLRNTSFVNERPVESGELSSSRGTNSTTIRTGFSMSILPRVLRDKSMLLQFTLELSKLEDIGEFGGVQTPRTRSRSFMQRTRIKSGQTMILTGFEQIENSREGEGSWLSGFTSNASHLEQRIVLMMTPVMDQ